MSILFGGREAEVAFFERGCNLMSTFVFPYLKSSHLEVRAFKRTLTYSCTYFKLNLCENCDMNTSSCGKEDTGFRNAIFLSPLLLIFIYFRCMYFF